MKFHKLYHPGIYHASTVCGQIVSRSQILVFWQDVDWKRCLRMKP